MQKKKQTHRCNYCKSTFNLASSLSNHMKRCREKQDLIDNHTKEKKELQKTIDEYLIEINKQNDTIKSYETKIEILEIKIDCLNKLLNKDEKIIENEKTHIDDLRDTNQQYKSIVDNAGKIVDKSMSAFKMIVTKFNEAPAITEFSNFDSIKKCIKDTKKYDLADLIIYHHTEKELGDFLGDFIIKEFKKEDPSEQSFWVTDVTRLSCVVRKAINDNKAIWDRDKNAEYAKKYLIQPIVNFVEEILTEKDRTSAIIIQKCIPGILGKASDGSQNKKKYLGKTWEEAYYDQIKALEILQPARKNKLEEDILNKIINVFTINKEQFLIE